MSRRKPQTFPEYEELDLDQLRGERRSMNLRKEEHLIALREINARAVDLNTRINELRNGETGIGVSDHAVIRYLERVKGFDIPAIRDEIRSRAVLSKIENVPDQVVTDQDDVSLAIFDGNRIATIWVEPKPEAE